MPGRHQKDKPPQREHRRSGVTKQYAGRRPEPVSPAGNPQTEDAPKGNAATLRPTTDALLSIRFRGSMRELFFGEISLRTGLAGLPPPALQSVGNLARGSGSSPRPQGCQPDLRYPSSHLRSTCSTVG